MNDARIIINVSDQDHMHANGISGNWIVPGKGEDEFGMLVVFNARELQDVGNNIKSVHWPSSTSVAQDVVGAHSDASAHSMGTRGGTEKWGILLCEANPDIPRELLEAEEKQRVLLADNRPDIKQRRDPKTRMMLSTTVYPPEIEKRLIEAAKLISKLRERFTAFCRTLVTKAEIAKVKLAQQTEDARLVSEGDTMWAGNEQSKRQQSELHKRACVRLGQDRPWCYTAQQLVDCPGCGAKIKENVLSCPQCHGWLDEGVDKLRAMPPKQRKVKMYPETMEPATAG